ncbi:MAG: DNA polymerase III subunit gamma and tau [Dermatophilaceae bacterium]
MSTALYRRYRPETFADVIGQEHVTEPLMQALRTGRVNHAYLFSGPRGCGKTTSARILARCLNCEQGPTPEPCGVCDSCVALARGGPGTVDVIEIDAASHGGVDDARDLRERASYGPAQSRFKVYIIDEAHMVTPQGFNALLKIVEEPPEHVKFVFATTEPEKVIGTIRSRTHHYPFRLVPPARLQAYLDELCSREGVAVAPGVLSFVVRAGGGSVRDSLSVLDQLIAGSGESGLTYESAAALLGFTDGELLDATVDALAAGDAAAAFRAVDRVVETGLDPRRFVEDLLERLRDLIIVQAVGDGAAAVLRHHPEDQLARMGHQAAAFGAGALSRAADLANAGLTEMTGATAPRLQLEILIARVLLPGAAGEQGYATRLDRLERRLDVGGVPSAARGSTPPRSQGHPAESGHHRSGTPQQPAESAQPEDSAPPAQPPRELEPDAAGSPPSDAASSSSTAKGTPEPDAAGSPLTGSAPSGHMAEMPPESTPDDERSAGSDGHDTGLSRGATDVAQPPAGSAAEAPTPGRLDTDAVRRSWPDVLIRLGELRRTTWTLVSQNAQVADYDGERVVLTVATAGLAEAFRRGSHADYVRQALVDVLGLDTRVEAVPGDVTPLPPTAPDAAPPGGAASTGGAHATTGSTSSTGTASTTGTSSTAGAASATGTASATGSMSVTASPSGSVASGGQAASTGSGSSDTGRSSAERGPLGHYSRPDGPASAGLPGSTAGPSPVGGGSPGPVAPPTPGPAWSSPLEQARAQAAAEPVTPPVVIDDSAISPDDEAVDGAGDVGVPVIERVLGGTVVAEDRR